MHKAPGFPSALPPSQGEKGSPVLPGMDGAMGSIREGHDQEIE